MAEPLQHEQMRIPTGDPIEAVYIGQDNGPLIAAVATLWHREGDSVVDMTYGRGRFWTVFKPANLVGHDLIGDGVDFRALPEADESTDLIVFDPPYVVTGGTASSTTPDFQNRYGLDTAPETRSELIALWKAGIEEAWRIGAPKARLWIKCTERTGGSTSTRYGNPSHITHMRETRRA